MSDTELIKITILPVNGVLTLGSSPVPTISGEMLRIMKGDSGDTVTPEADDLGGFSTDPLAYYILSSN
uniref:Tail fiber protein n=1 Tax=Pseudomonas phage Cygsa01 TaxID=3138529 RepID=A0AAU6W3D1_9VIRU